MDEDGTIRYTQNMLLAGCHEMEKFNILKEGTSYETLMAVVARVFTVMRRAEPPIIKQQTKFFISGGKS